MEAIIGSKSRVKLMTLFLLNPEKRFYLREIARKTEENVNSVRRELKNLEGTGLLRSERVGNLKYYSVNTTMPIYAELRDMFLKTEGIAGVLREKLNELGKIESAFIYGSFAKREGAEGSDIDLFMIGRVDEERLILLLRELEKRLTREINYVLFTPEEFRERIEKKDPFVGNVMAEEKIEIIGDASGL